MLIDKIKVADRLMVMKNQRKEDGIRHVFTPYQEAARADGNEFIYLPPAEVDKLRALAEGPVAERWIATVAEKGVDGRPLIAEAKSLIEKYQRQLGVGY